MGDPVRLLKELGHDLTAIPIANLPPTFAKVAFLCVNTHCSFRQGVGVPPINDAVLLANCLRRFSFEIYFLHNPHSGNFLRYLDVFFTATTGRLVLFYVGQGAGLHEDAFIFDDGQIPESEMVDHLIENKNANCEVILITDACRSGTIWDIQNGKVKGRALPPGVISLSSATDAETAKQTKVGGVDQSAFTYNLTKTLQAEPFSSPSELHGKLRAVLKKYGLNFVVGASTPALLNKPLLT
jgi:hypothetical protein